MARHKGPRKPSAPRKPPLTHFLCLPLVTSGSKPQLEAALQTFKDDVCSSDLDVENAGREDQESVPPAVHPKAIRPVGALHCTLGVMSLDRNKLAEAIEYLQNLDISTLLSEAMSKPATLEEEPAAAANASGLSSTLERPISPPKIERSTKPLEVRLKGLKSMHDPEKTSILYSAPSDDTGRLLPFCLRVQQLFKEKDFLVEADRELKLHATIVNTIYAKGRKRPSKEPQGGSSAAGAGQHDGQAQGHGSHANASLKIDATAILEKYMNFVWAEHVVLDRVAICEMGAKKMDSSGNVVDEAYTEVASISLLS